ncbi:MAG TPA: hypothetical protein VKA92_10030, partial [Segetibacter sp.]|nr:hypothetical protein [Segetibacter sp.]
AFRRAVVYYGDIFFNYQSQQNMDLPAKFIKLIIKAAGSIKGDNSTNFLVDRLSKKSRYFNEIIEALWLKKPNLTTAAITTITHHVANKIEQSKSKVAYYRESIHNKSLLLLQQSIMMEIRQDLQVLLKAFALLYERDKVDRVIELLSLGNTAKISNAIEIAELIIPKKYFIPLNTLVELINDVKHDDVMVTKNRVLPAGALIEEILKNNKANFSEWTRSIACYTLPKLKKNEFSLTILDGDVSKDDYLFNETKNYVLTMLK